MDNIDRKKLFDHFRFTSKPTISLYNMLYEEGLMEDTDPLIVQLCKDLNQAHDELMKAEGLEPSEHDWPEWTPQANSIRKAEEIIGGKLAKTNAWTLFPTE